MAGRRPEYRIASAHDGSCRRAIRRGIKRPAKYARDAGIKRLLADVSIKGGVDKQRG